MSGGRCLRRDPRAVVYVDDDRPPFARVRCEGEVTLSEDLDDMLGWSTRITRRYMGPELAERYGRRNAVPGELLVRLRPSGTASGAGVAD